MDKPLSNDMTVLTSEINELAEQLGVLAWKIGRRTLGKQATAQQIANYLSTQDFGVPGGFPAPMILNFLTRVKQDEHSR